MSADTMRVFVQNLAGAVLAFNVHNAATVHDLKLEVHAAPEKLVECSLERQRLFVIKCSGASESPTMLDDEARTLASYGIGNDSTVHVVVRARELGEFVRSIEARTPWGVCVSPDDAHLFVAEWDSVGTIHAWRTANDTHIGAFGTLDHPSGVCISPDGAHLFAADFYKDRVQVFEVWSLASRSIECGDESTPVAPLVRTLGAGAKGDGAGVLDYPRNVCLSPCGAFLYVSEYGNDRIHVFHSADGTPVRSFGVKGSGIGEFLNPRGMCVSPDGEMLFVAESGNHRVQVVRTADGAHVRAFGAQGAGAREFSEPTDVCMSPDGELLFVADSGNDRVQVLRAACGEHVLTIGSRGSGKSQLCDPSGVCLSRSGDLLFVADRRNNRVQVFAASL